MSVVPETSPDTRSWGRWPAVDEPVPERHPIPKNDDTLIPRSGCRWARSVGLAGPSAPEVGQHEASKSRQRLEAWIAGALRVLSPVVAGPVAIRPGLREIQEGRVSERKPSVALQDLRVLR